MKHRFGTWFLLLSLFVAASANRALACGSNDTEHAAKFHHAHSSATHGHETADPADHGSDLVTCCDPDHPDRPCSNEEGSGHCHCPGCATACHAPAACVSADVAIFYTFICNASVQRQAFYFAQHLPEAVYLPIWQPPKLGA